MNSPQSLVTAAVALALATAPAMAESVAENWNGGDLGGWQPITNDQVVEVLPSGGVDDSGYLHAYQTAPTFGISGAIQRFDPYVGDYGVRGYIVVQCDLRFFDGTFDEVVFRARYLDSGHNGWYVPLTTDFSPGAWRTATIQFDPEWSDGEALAAGWIQESNSGTFQETMANVFTAEVRVLGDGALEVGIDNFLLDDDPVAVESIGWSQVRTLFR